MGSERAIMELLIELQNEKKTTVVFVTHLLSTIERYAHRVAIITSDGELLVGDKDGAHVAGCPDEGVSNPDDRNSCPSPFCAIFSWPAYSLRSVSRR